MMYKDKNRTKVFNSVEQDIKNFINSNPMVFSAILDSADSKRAKMHISGYIGWENWEDWDSVNTKAKLQGILNDLGDGISDIDLEIDSLGGDFNTAIGMYDALAEHPAKVHVRIHGMTASAATIIASAGDDIKISDTAMYLIHKSIGLTIGNIYVHKDAINTLEKVDSIINSVYANRGVNKDDIKSLMEENQGKGKWLNAKETVKYKLADETFKPTIVYNMATADMLNTFGYPELAKPSIVDNVLEKLIGIYNSIKNKKDMKINNDSKLAQFINSLGLDDEKKNELLQNIAEEVVSNEAEGETAIANAVTLNETITAHVATIAERDETIANHATEIAAKDEIITNLTTEKEALEVENKEYKDAEEAIKNNGATDKVVNQFKRTSDPFDPEKKTEADVALDKVAEQFQKGNPIGE